MWKFGISIGGNLRRRQIERDIFVESEAGVHRNASGKQMQGLNRN